MYPNERVAEHYRHPRNVGSLDRSDPAVGSATVGTPARSVMQLALRIGRGRVIEEARFKVFGCVHTIACSSLATTWLEGRTVAEALGITSAAIAAELALPPEKVHCSELPVTAIRAAVDDYEKKSPVRSRTGDRGGGGAIEQTATDTVGRSPGEIMGRSPE